MISRRFFVRSTAVALASFARTPGFLVRTALAQSNKAKKPVVIAIFQRGAMDGISMVVPYGDPHYRAVRPQIAIQSPIDLDGFFGLHPSLDSLKPIYDEGHLAVVHAVGSPDNTRSHFDAQDYMESGAPGNKSVGDGWLNRYMQVNKEANPSLFRAVALRANMPRSLMGPAPALAMSRIQDFDVRAGRGSDDLFGAFESMWKNDTFEAVKMLKQINPARLQPENGAQYPNGQYGQALQQMAQLIKADVGMEVGFLDIQ